MVVLGQNAVLLLVSVWLNAKCDRHPSCVLPWSNVGKTKGTFLISIPMVHCMDSRAARSWRLPPKHCSNKPKHYPNEPKHYSNEPKHVSNKHLSFCLFPPQPVTSSPWEWQPSLAPPTARRPTQSSPFVMPWGCPTSRPSGSTRCRTTGTRTMSASTQTSSPSAGPSWNWSTSSNGGRSLWSMTTAQVQVQISWMIDDDDDEEDDDDQMVKDKKRYEYKLKLLLKHKQTILSVL